MIVVGSDSFAEKIAEKMACKFVKLETKIFPDGECYLRISEKDKIKGQNVIAVLRDKTPGHNQDRLLTKTLLVIHKLKELGAKKVGLFLPYMPYARQDKEFLPGEIVSVKILRKILEEKCDLIVSVTNHDKREEGWIDKKFYNIDATDSAIKFLLSKNFRNPIIAAPDMTSKKNVEKIAKSLKGSVLTVKKERDYKTGEIKSYGKIPDLKGRTLIIFDDIVSTGNTMLKAIKMAKEATPEKIICVVIHALDVWNSQVNSTSIKAIKEICDEFYASDTIENPVESFSVIDQAIEFFKKKF